jgi:hypothetical protein
VGRKAVRPIAGVAKGLKVKLSEDLAADLWAFCEAHHGAPHNRVIEKALKKFIAEDLQEHPTLQGRWHELREQLRQDRSRNQVVKLVPNPRKGEEL